MWEAYLATAVNPGWICVVEVRVLGPIEIAGNDGPVHVGGRRQRRLLALLSARAPRATSVDRLAEDLWCDDERPANAVATLRTYVSRLRASLDDVESVVTTEDGYALNLERVGIDILRFKELVERAERHQQIDSARAADVLGEALDLWRGTAFGESADEDGLRAEAAHLEELRLVATERRLDALLDLGAHGAVAAELEGLVKQHSLRERFHGQLMLALHRAGRTAEASLAYQDYRSQLIDHSGVQPSAELNELQSFILSGDPRVDVACPAQLVARLPAW